MTKSAIYFMTSRRRRPWPRGAPSQTHWRAMASAEGSGQYFRTSALVYEAVECRPDGRPLGPPGAPRLRRRGWHVFGTRAALPRRARRQASPPRDETAAAAVASGGARAPTGSPSGGGWGTCRGSWTRSNWTTDDAWRSMPLQTTTTRGCGADASRASSRSSIPRTSTGAFVAPPARPRGGGARAAEDDATENNAPARGTRRTRRSRPPRTRTTEPARQTEIAAQTTGTAAAETADVRALLAKPDGARHRAAAQRCFDLFAAIHDLCTDHGPCAGSPRRRRWTREGRRSLAANHAKTLSVERDEGFMRRRARRFCAR